MATRRELFSYLTCPLSTTFLLLSIFSLAETIILKIWVRPLSWHVKCSLAASICGSKMFLSFVCAALRPFSCILSNFYSSNSLINNHVSLPCWLSSRNKNLQFNPIFCVKLFQETRTSRHFFWLLYALISSHLGVAKPWRHRWAWCGIRWLSLPILGPVWRDWIAFAL